MLSSVSQICWARNRWDSVGFDVSVLFWHSRQLPLPGPGLHVLSLECEHNLLQCFAEAGITRYVGIGKVARSEYPSFSLNEVNAADTSVQADTFDA